MEVHSVLTDLTEERDYSVLMLNSIVNVLPGSQCLVIPLLPCDIIISHDANVVRAIQVRKAKTSTTINLPPAVVASN